MMLVTVRSKEMEQNRKCLLRARQVRCPLRPSRFAAIPLLTPAFETYGGRLAVPLAMSDPNDSLQGEEGRHLNHVNAIVDLCLLFFF